MAAGTAGPDLPLLRTGLLAAMNPARSGSPFIVRLTARTFFLGAVLSLLADMVAVCRLEAEAQQAISDFDGHLELQSVTHGIHAVANTFGCRQHACLPDATSLPDTGAMSVQLMPVRSQIEQLTVNRPIISAPIAGPPAEPTDVQPIKPLLEAEERSPSRVAPGLPANAEGGDGRRILAASGGARPLDRRRPETPVDPSDPGSVPGRTLIAAGASPSSTRRVPSKSAGGSLRLPRVRGEPGSGTNAADE